MKLKYLISGIIGAALCVATVVIVNQPDVEPCQAVKHVALLKPVADLPLPYGIASNKIPTGSPVYFDLVNEGCDSPNDTTLIWRYQPPFQPPEESATVMVYMALGGDVVPANSVITSVEVRERVSWFDNGGGNIGNIVAWALTDSLEAVLANNLYDVGMAQPGDEGCRNQPWERGLATYDYTQSQIDQLRILVSLKCNSENEIAISEVEVRVTYVDCESSSENPLSTTPILHVNGDQTSPLTDLQLEPDSGTRFSKINSGLDTPDDNTYLWAGSSSRGSAFDIEDVPLDVGTVTMIEARIRYRTFDNGGDFAAFAAGLNFYQGPVTDAVSIADINFFEVNQPHDDDVWINTAWFPLENLIDPLALTQVQANGVSVLLTETSGVDNNIYVAEVDIRMTYTPASAGGISSNTAKHKMSIGQGFGPGFR